MARSLTCVRVQDRLDAYLGQGLGLAERASVERHLADCSSCRDELAFLRTLIRDAKSLPRSLDPERDLWQEIAERLAAGGHSGRWRWSPLAAAAVAIVALSGALAVAVFVRDPQPPPVVTSAPGPMPAAARTLEAEYTDAMAELQSALEAGRDVLAPETVAVIEESLRLIDVAIAEARHALAADSANAELARRLAAGYAMKVDLLRRAARLAAEI